MARLPLERLVARGELPFPRNKKLDFF